MFRLAEEKTNNTTNLCNSTIDSRNNLIVHVPTKRARLSPNLSISSISSDDNTTMSFNSSDIDDEENEIDGGNMPPYLSLLEIAMLDWQEAQICRSIVDNAVNVVVESYRTLIESNPSDTPDEQLAEAVEVDTSLEESAILMAINEHGLQQHNITDEDDEDDADDLLDGYDDDDEDDYGDNDDVGDDDNDDYQCLDAPIESVTLVSSMNSTNSSELRNNDVNHLVSVHEITTTINDGKQQENLDNNTFVNYECISGTSSGRKDDNSDNDNATNECEEVSDHLSFIETAVAVAIEKKGLTKSLYAIQMSPNR